VNLSLGRGIAARLSISLLAVVCGLALFPVPAWAAFPGENGQIAVSVLGNDGFDIYKMNPDGTARADLTNTTETREHQPIWSPDGTKISYVREFESDGGDDFRAYVMDADGSHARLIRRDAPAAATWTPDGKQLMLALFLYGLDGTAAGRLFPDIEATWSAYSPDGSLVAYTTSPGNQLWTMNADGTDRRQLTTNAVVDADWSPDGGLLAFTNPAPTGIGLYTVAPKTTLNDTRLLLAESFDLPIQGRVSWSPNGAKLTFGVWDCCADPRASYIGIVDADGTNPHVISKPGVGDYDANWGTAEDTHEPPVDEAPAEGAPQPKTKAPPARRPSAPFVRSEDPLGSLTKGRASAEARKALKHRYGHSYTRGKKKRLACKKQNATRYRCAFSFESHKKRRAGTVAVAVNASGAATAVVRTARKS
jgi:hypothetical protein